MLIHDNIPLVYHNEQFLKNLPVFLNTCSIEPFEESRLHCHEFIEIGYVTSGSGWHQIRDEVHRCKTGDTYILYTGVPHCFFVSPDDDSSMVVKNLLFIPEFIYNEDFSNQDIISIYKKFTSSVINCDTAAIRIELSPQQLGVIEHIYNEIDEETRNTKEGYLTVINACITLFLIKLARFLQDNITDTVSYFYMTRSLVESAEKYISNNFYNNHLTLDIVAKNIHTGRSYLSRLFKQEIGEHFSEYLKRTRLNESCRLLIDSDRTNEDIMSVCGFNDLPTFYSNFKKYTGLTPKQYRSIHRQNKNKK